MKIVKTTSNYRKAIVAVLLLSSSTIFAQDFGLTSAVDSLYDVIRANAGKIIAMIFLVSVFINIGKLTGSDRDYKGFFIGLLLWIVGIAMVISLFAYLSTLSF